MFIKKISTALIMLGIISMILNFIDYVPKMLTWIYNWGEAVAWVIMIAMVVAGVLLNILIRKNTKNDLYVQPKAEEANQS